MKRQVYCSFILLSFVAKVSAQSEGVVYERNDSARVFAYSNEKSMPWCGGFNNPQFAMGDLNNDGKTDLVVFERLSYQVKTFINTGTGGNPVYVYAPKYALNFPAIRVYLKLEDYDRDGTADLMEHGSQGVNVYKGYFNANNELCFTFRQELKYSNDLSTVPPVGVNVNGADIPAIVDVDNDGDLDIVSYNSLGNELYYYKNDQVEQSLSPDTMAIKLRDKCWGKISQNTQYRTHIMHYSCEAENSTLLPKGYRHGSNGVCLFDADGDGDYDILDGNGSFSDIQFLQNGRVQNGGRDSMVYQDTTWQRTGVQAHMPQYPVAFWLDINQDGKKDLLISPHAEGGSENYKCVLYYKNTGTVASPVYTYQSDSLIVEQTIDAGTGSYPMLYDYDKDGKPDLIVGSDGYYQPNGTLKSKLQYYKNTSVPGHISFALQDANFANIFALNLSGAAPAVGDLDNDGKDDLVLGQSAGTLTFFPNTAASAAVQPQWSAFWALKDYNNLLVNAGNKAAPFIYDLNKDGKNDLIIGNESGQLVYYENVGSGPGQLKLQLKTSQLGNIAIDPGYLYANAVPYIGKMDNTGTDYILCGSASGRLYRFDGFQGGNTAITYPMTDNRYSYIDTAYAMQPGYTNNINQRSSPAVADIDGDGKYDMILGNTFGGLTIYKQVINVAFSANLTAGNNHEVKVYPNPAKDMLYFSWTSSFAQGTVEIYLYSTTGQKILQHTATAQELSVALPIHDIAAGTYFCEFQSGTNRVVTPVSIYR